RISKRRSRARRLPSTALPRLVPAHHPRHVRPRIPGHLRPPPQEQQSKQQNLARKPGHPRSTIADTAQPPTQNTPTQPRRSKIPLTIAEIRRLFNARNQAKHPIHHALHWSDWRREHQAEARWHHFRRRLKIQIVAL